jgi:hypothetical protein
LAFAISDESRPAVVACLWRFIFVLNLTDSLKVVKVEFKLFWGKPKELTHDSKGFVITSNQLREIVGNLPEMKVWKLELGCHERTFGAANKGVVLICPTRCTDGVSTRIDHPMFAGFSHSVTLPKV